MFDSAEKFENLVQSYFETVREEKMPPTITGLALHLGFESRQSFYDYEKKDGFAYTVKRARLRIENMYEQNLHGTTATGSIFALKNMGWTDRQEIDQKTEISGTLSVDYTKLSDAALAEIAGLDQPKTGQD